MILTECDITVGTQNACQTGFVSATYLTSQDNHGQDSLWLFLCIYSINLVAAGHKILKFQFQNVSMDSGGVRAGPIQLLQSDRNHHQSGRWPVQGCC